MKLVYQDQEHSYWLDGTRAKSISKVAQITADRFAIEQYMKRMVGVGFTLDPTLRERAAVDLENKKLVQTVCDDAETVAKSHARADRGTQRHRVLELTLLGQTEFITDQQRADNLVLQRTLDAYGLEPIANMVEGFVAWPDHMVVGRYDAVLRYEATGCPVLVDLKGGENAILYPHTTLTQTALYLFAPHISANVVKDGDRSTVTEWTTMPADIDTENAYVIYCDDHHDVGEMWRLDMAHGLAGATLALSVVDWRKKHGYGKQAVTKVAAPTVGRPTGDRNSSPLSPATSINTTAPYTMTTVTVTATPEQLALSNRRNALRARFHALPRALQKQFKARGFHPDNLDDIAALLDELENPPNIRDLAAATSKVGR